MTDILKQAEELNKRVKQLNQQRDRQLGQQEVAKERYEAALEAYKVKYGVELTESNLQAEYTKVYTDVKLGVEKLKVQIEGIESGAYKAKETLPEIELEPVVEIPEDIKEEIADIKQTEGAVAESIRTNMDSLEVEKDENKVDMLGIQDTENGIQFGESAIETENESEGVKINPEGWGVGESIDAQFAKMIGN